MAQLSPDVTAALATLRSRWGSAAPAPAGETIGALALQVLGEPATSRSNDDPLTEDRGKLRGPSVRGRVLSTGFAALDAILGPGGLPHGMGLSLRGELSSGRTTIALRLVAEAQAAGSIAAWLDLAAAFDPVEAVARGVRPEWLVVLTPADADEGLAIAGSLLSGRTVDLLVIDLPLRMPGGRRIADRLGRLAALARRAGITLVVLEPPGLRQEVAAAIGEATGIRLELARRSWIHLGRDVVGQRTEVVVGRNRAGPPGRRATIRVLYADGGERDACLRRDGLLIEPPVNAPVIPVPGNRNHAIAASLSPASPPRSGEAAPALRLVAGGTGGPRREAVVGRAGPGRRSGGPGPRRPARDPARIGAPAGAGGDLSGARSRG